MTLSLSPDARSFEWSQFVARRRFDKFSSKEDQRKFTPTDLYLHSMNLGQEGAKNIRTYGDYIIDWRRYWITNFLRIWVPGRAEADIIDVARLEMERTLGCRIYVRKRNCGTVNISSMTDIFSLTKYVFSKKKTGKIDQSPSRIEVSSLW